MQGLADDVVDSSELSTNSYHDELKAADGWYYEDSNNSQNLVPTDETVQQRIATDKGSMKQADIKLYQSGQSLAPEPSEKCESIVRGSHASAPRPARYVPFAQSSPGALAGPEPTIPRHLVNFVGTGYTSTPTNPLPAYIGDQVIVTRYPRSLEGDEDEMMGG